MNTAKEEYQRKLKDLERKEKKLNEDIIKRQQNGSPYKDWVQWNQEHYDKEEKLLKESSIAYRVFKFLVKNMDKYNAVMVSYNTIGEYLDISKTSVYNAIKKLKKENFIVVFKSGNSNVYAVNDKIVWKNFGNKYKYSKFPANVILSESEQEKSVRKKIKEYRHKEIEIKE